MISPAEPKVRSELTRERVGGVLLRYRDVESEHVDDPIAANTPSAVACSET
jgi:hypothetical protein